MDERPNSDGADSLGKVGSHWRQIGKAWQRGWRLGRAIKLARLDGWTMSYCIDGNLDGMTLVAGILSTQEASRRTTG